MHGHGSSLLNGVQQDRLSNAVAAGTSLITGTAISCKHKANLLFIFLVGTLTATAVTKCKLQASTDGGSNYNDIEGSGVDLTPTTDDNKAIGIELINPLPTWTHVRPIVSRGTANAVLDGILCESTGQRSEPVTSGVHASSKRLITPAVGTA